MKYFLHDSNAFNDEKIHQLYLKFGYEGLGLFYTILEKLALQEKPINTEILKSQLNIGKKLSKCWTFLENIELISSSNGQTFNKQLLNYSKKYQIKKQRNADKISQWRENQKTTENVTNDVTSYETVTKQVRNDDKVKLSKVNEDKVNENLLQFETPIEYENYFLKNKHWVETCCMALSFSTIDLSNYLRKFLLLQSANNNLQRSVFDIRVHFVSWTRIELEKIRSNNTKGPSTFDPKNYLD